MVFRLPPACTNITETITSWHSPSTTVNAKLLLVESKLNNGLSGGGFGSSCFKTHFHFFTFFFSSSLCLLKDLR
jgi:hypothetical protein